MIINNNTTMTILSYDNAMNIFVEKLNKPSSIQLEYDEPF